VTATIPPSGVTCIVGPSGSGKSTLLRLCNRLMVPTSGRVLFRGDDVAALDPLALRRRVGMVFQRPTPFGGTVRENLEVALPGGSDGRYGEALAQAALDESFLDRDATRLSGGEAQRMCLARTLITDPDVLLMDEPTSALDEETGRGLEQLAGERARDGLPVLWVTHDRAQVERIADRVLTMSAGRVAQ
jgi:putative ABC transport system ATP-binding protein